MPTPLARRVLDLTTMAVPAAARAVLTLLVLVPVLVLVLPPAGAAASADGDGGSSWCAFHPNGQPGACHAVGRTRAVRCGRRLIIAR